MIDDSDLTSLVEHSKNQRSLNYILRKYIFRVTETSLVSVYNSNYSTLCLQSSYIIKAFLNNIGIKSTIFLGSLCVMKVSVDDPPIIGWTGFWDQEHHVWLITEFDEIVDLTISHLHLHPSTSGKGDEPIPPVWWNPIDVWPSIIKYLPEGPIQIQLEEKEMRLLEKLKDSLGSSIEFVNQNFSLDNNLFDDILFGPSSLDLLTSKGNSWLKKCLQIQNIHIQVPDWISNKENELINKYKI